VAQAVARFPLPVLLSGPCLGWSSNAVSLRKQSNFLCLQHQTILVLFNIFLHFRPGPLPAPDTPGAPAAQPTAASITVPPCAPLLLLQGGSCPQALRGGHVRRAVLWTEVMHCAMWPTESDAARRGASGAGRNAHQRGSFWSPPPVLSVPPNPACCASRRPPGARARPFTSTTPPSTQPGPGPAICYALLFEFCALLHTSRQHGSMPHGTETMADFGRLTVQRRPGQTQAHPEPPGRRMPPPLPPYRLPVGFWGGHPPQKRKQAPPYALAPAKPPPSIGGGSAVGVLRPAHRTP
jgi:hypothetical protein